MGFLNTNSMPHLVEKLSDGDNIKITGNSKGNRVGTVIKKIVEKADDVTKAIEQEVVNDSYSFKVGTGQVDVSSDVEDGFGEVGLKGVTYQNLLLTPKDEFPISILQGLSHSLPILPPTKDITLIAKFSNIVEGTGYRFWIGNKYYDGSFSPIVRLKWNYSDVANATNVSFGCHQSSNQAILTELIILEGDHVDNPNIPNHFEGIVGVGDESKNLFKEPPVKLKIWSGNHFNHNIGVLKLKKNTTYSIVHNANKTLPDGRINVFEVSINKDNTLTLGSSLRQILLNGASTFTTGSCDVCLISAYKINSADATEDVILDGLCIREGNEMIYEPYYDGSKIEILSSDDIATSLKNCNQKGGTTANVSTKDYPSTLYSYHKFFITKPCKVRIKIIKKTKNPISGQAIFRTWACILNSNNNVLHNFYHKTVKKENGISLETEELDLSNYVGSWFGITFRDIDLLPLLENYHICILVDNMPKYPLNKSDKSQILLDEPLMRLPNGTHDEITRDGKLIRRVVKVVLDGSENWSLSDGTKENTIRFSTIPQIPFKILTEAISDKFPYYQNTGNNVECFTVANDTKIHIRIERSKLNVANVQGFKQWLSENPTTVYYELETPITTELPAPYLRIFKDGHLTFNTLVAPKSNHVVQLNKSAQIERSIREVQSLDSRVGKLESFYDDMMLEINHKLSLLNYDFEYTRERNGE
ncbi:MAG: hypothetical protein ACI3T9_05465 [Romboutsia timonensis]